MIENPRAVKMFVCLATLMGCQILMQAADGEGRKIGSISYYSDSQTGGELSVLRNRFTDLGLIAKFKEAVERRDVIVCRAMVIRPHYLVLRDSSGNPMGGYLVNWGCVCPAGADKATACLRPILISEKEGKVFWSNPPSFRPAGFAYTPFPEFQAIFKVSPEIEF